MSPQADDAATLQDDRVESGDKKQTPRDAADLAASLQAITEERDQLLEELESAHKETQDFRKERDRLKDELDRKSNPPSSDEQSPSDSTAANAELERLRTGLEERTAELNQVREEFEAAEEALVEQEDEIHSLETKLEELQTGAPIESPDANAAAEDRYEAELAALRADFEANLKMEKEQAAEQLAALEATHAKALEKLESKLLAQNKNTITRLQNQVESLQARMEKAKRYQDTVVKLAAREVADARRITELIVRRGMSFKQAKKAVAEANQQRDAEMPRTDREIRRQMAEDDLWNHPVTT